MKKHICPVCGWDELSEPAYYEDIGSLEICHCCLFQYGNDDDDKGFTHEQWREKWVEEGMKFNDGDDTPPPGWNPKQQLLNIGVKID